MNAAAGEVTVFAPGETVRLNSGGPVMTVLDQGRHSGLVWCRWMGEDDAVMEAKFPPEALCPQG